MRRALVALALVSALVAPARGEPALDADAYHRAGEAAYRAGDYRAAVTAFEEAVAQQRRPQSVFSLAQAYRHLYVHTNDASFLLRAVELYRQYLAQVPRQGRSADARELLGNLEPLAQLLRERDPALRAAASRAATQLLVWSQQDGATAVIDGGGATALPHIAVVTPGEHTLVVTAPQHAAATWKVTAIADRMVPIEARLVPHPARLTVASTDGARIAVDGLVRTGSVVELAPGAHTVWAGARGHLGVTQRLVLAPGESRRLALALPPSPARRRARWLVTGAAVLAGVSAGALGYAAVRSSDARALYDVRATRPWTAAELDAYTRDRDATATWRTVGLVGLGAAVLAGLAGGAIWYADVPEPPAR